MMDWRANIARMRTAFWRTAKALEPEAPALASVRETAVAGAAHRLPARLYTPFAAGAPQGAGLVFFHGGGFITGDLDSHDMICRRLAAAGRVRVLSVAYRLAPQHKHPAAVEDALAATRAAFAEAARFGFDSARLAIGGDSAGGNLAAVTAQALRTAEGPRLAAQLLIYPCTQFVQMTPERLGWRHGQQLTQAAQDYFKDQYLAAREDAFDTRVSPLLAQDLSGLPPTLLITAGVDPLRDEGRAYGDKLQACGVAVTRRDYPKEMHGFFNMTALSASARAAVEDAGAWLARTLTPA